MKTKRKKYFTSVRSSITWNIQCPSFVSIEIIKQARVMVDDDDGRAKWVSFTRLLHHFVLNSR